MGILGQGPIFRVTVVRRDGSLLNEVFKGENCFGNASDFFDLKKAENDVKKVDLDRYDGQDWHSMEMFKR